MIKLLLLTTVQIKVTWNSRKARVDTVVSRLTPGSTTLAEPMGEKESEQTDIRIIAWSYYVLSLTAIVGKNKLRTTHYHITAPHCLVSYLSPRCKTRFEGCRTSQQYGDVTTPDIARRVFPAIGYVVSRAYSLPRTRISPETVVLSPRITFTTFRPPSAPLPEQDNVRRKRNVRRPAAASIAEPSVAGCIARLRRGSKEGGTSPFLSPWKEDDVLSRMGRRRWRHGAGCRFSEVTLRG